MTWQTEHLAASLKNTASPRVASPPVISFGSGGTADRLAGLGGAQGRVMSERARARSVLLSPVDKDARSAKGLSPAVVWISVASSTGSPVDSTVMDETDAPSSERTSPGSPPRDGSARVWD